MGGGGVYEAILGGLGRNVHTVRTPWGLILVTIKYLNHIILVMIKNGICSWKSGRNFFYIPPVLRVARFRRSDQASLSFISFVMNEGMQAVISS